MTSLTISGYKYDLVHVVILRTAFLSSQYYHVLWSFTVLQCLLSSCLFPVSEELFKCDEVIIYNRISAYRVLIGF